MHTCTTSEHFVAGLTELLHAGPLGGITGKQSSDAGCEYPQLPLVLGGEHTCLPRKRESIQALDSVYHLQARPLTIDEFCFESSTWIHCSDIKCVLCSRNLYAVSLHKKRTDTSSNLDVKAANETKFGDSALQQTKASH